MISSYTTRLVLELLATFFVVSVALGILATAAGLLLPRLTRWLPARSVADIALVLRLLPFIGSFAVTAGICAPSYLRFEPMTYQEVIGLPCILAACLGAAPWLESIGRAAVALRQLHRFYRQCQSRLITQSLAGNSDYWLIQSSSPVVVCAGFLDSTLIVSDRVHDLLLPNQMQLVLAHEAAHALSFDNVKRLLILLTPDIFPAVRCLRRLERTWEALAEWAADDHAVHGEPGSALQLAEALLLIAKASQRALVSPTANLVCLFAHNPQSLSGRVERLLNFEANHPRTIRASALSLIGTATGALAGCAVVWMNLSKLQMVHIWLERLVR